MPSTPDITIFGAGAWGTALAVAWARQGARVDLWGHPPSLVTTLARTRRHPSLADVELPLGVRPITDPAEGFQARLWVSALPTQVVPQVWQDLAQGTRLREVGHMPAVEDVEDAVGEHHRSAQACA